MKSRISRCVQLLFLFLLAFSILRDPGKACSYAALALRLWFEKMIPSLFPFMVLSGLVVRLGFSHILSYPVYPFAGRLCRMNRTMCTSLLLGFFFGFPLGAKTIAEQYSFRQLTKQEAQYLLSFCNNIGPVYLLSFALPLLGLSGRPEEIPILLIYFGIPLLYGLFLRYTRYRQESFRHISPNHSPSGRLKDNKQPVLASSFLSALDASVISACAAITRLGGYMVFFMVCNTLIGPGPYHAPFISVFFSGVTPLQDFFHSVFHMFPSLMAIILEITSGLSLAKDALPLSILLTMLTFGGLSCFAQTYTCIRKTDLSFRDYCRHKLIQTAIAFCLTLLFSVF